MYSMILFKTNQILVNVTQISCGPLPGMWVQEACPVELPRSGDPVLWKFPRFSQLDL